MPEICRVSEEQYAAIGPNCHFTDRRKWNCQDPDSQKCGCDIGCMPCDDEGEPGSINTLVGVPQGSSRILYGDPDKESRGADGRPMKLSSHTFGRAPLKWSAWLSACFRNDANAGTELDHPGSGTRLNACECHPKCSPEEGREGTAQDVPCCKTGFYVRPGVIDSCNVYLGDGWPHRPNLGNMICQHPQDEGPIRFVVASQRPELRQLGSARTGRGHCTSNSAVSCWGHRTYGAFTHCNPRSIDQYYVSNNLSAYWGNFDYLSLKRFTARMNEAGPYVDRSVTAIRNAVLAWIDADVSGGRNVLRFNELDSPRRGQFSQVDANGSLDSFKREWNLNHGLTWASLPSVAPLPNARLGRSFKRVVGTEIVLVDAKLELSVILRKRRSAPNGAGILGVFPIIRGRLTATIGIRGARIEGDPEFDGQTLSLVEADYAGKRYQPRVLPAGADHIVYRDAEGRYFVPPPNAIVDFDLGPFSDPPTRNIIIGTPISDSAERIHQGFRNVFIPCAKTNQNHADAAVLYTGGLIVSMTNA